jgi:KaiB-like protein
MSTKNGQKPRAPAASNGGGKPPEISLRLYIASSTPNSQRAKANLDAALREFAASRRFRVEIIDVLTDAKRVATDSVIVTPTLMVIGPKRRFVMIGDLSDPGKLEGLLKSAACLGP